LRRTGWRSPVALGASATRQIPGFVLIALLLIVGGLTTPDLMTVATWQALLNKVAIDLVIVIGLTFVLISGEVDLSVGSTAALGSVIWVEIANRDGTMVGFAVAIAAGAVAGLVNGLVVTRLRITSIIATIATMIAISGVVLVVSNGNDIEGTNIGLAISAQSPIPGLPFLSVLSVFAIACVLVGQLVVSFSRWGRRLYIVGDTRDRGQLSGINGADVRTVAFILSGVLAVVAGSFVGVTLSAGVPSYGSSTPLNDIAAAVIGGTSLFGGRGSVVKSASGVLAIGLVITILDLNAVSSIFQGVVVGIILVAVVIGDANWRGKMSPGKWRERGTDVVEVPMHSSSIIGR
jgi:ribose transport system permease protein